MPHLAVRSPGLPASLMVSALLVGCAGPAESMARDHLAARSRGRPAGPAAGEADGPSSPLGPASEGAPADASPSSPEARRRPDPLGGLELGAREPATVGSGASRGDPDLGSSAVDAALGRGLEGYVAVALERHPSVRADFERWRSAVAGISRARRLPDPTLGLAYFLESVETRVGPQEARLSVQQSFPWPTQLTAGAEAAAEQARALERSLEARSIQVSATVARAYWDLWQVRTTRTLHRAHLDVLRGLSESVGIRVATGSALLADLQQIDLSVARLEDAIAGMDEAERSAAARLRASIGARGELDLPTPGEPAPVALPASAFETLAEWTRSHPALTRYDALAASADSAAEAEGSARWPGFRVGADWIVTGDARMPGVPDDGKDAFVVSAGLTLPLWQDSYADAVEARSAEAAAHRADRRAREDEALAELSAAAAALRDSARRVRTFRSILVPQAESAFTSVLGAYTVGRGTVAQTLLAQRDLLELRVELEEARADHARAWARLEAVVGRGLRRREAPDRGETR